MSAQQSVLRASRLRRSSRLARRIDHALSAMRAGQNLRLQHRDGRPSWTIGGQSVAAEVATLIIASERVAPADGALFSDLPGQLWRYRQ